MSFINNKWYERRNIKPATTLKRAGKAKIRPEFSHECIPSVPQLSRSGSLVFYLGLVPLGRVRGPEVSDQLREPDEIEGQRQGRVVHSPCLMVSMIARSLTERRPTSSTFRSMASNWFAVTCWLTSEASLLTFMFASGRETKFFR